MVTGCVQACSLGCVTHFNTCATRSKQTYDYYTAQLMLQAVLGIYIEATNRYCCHGIQKFKCATQRQLPIVPTADTIL